MRVCKCEVPRDVADPRRTTCMNCQGVIVLPEWESSDKNLGEWFERLAEAMFPAYAASLDRRTIPAWFFHYYRECSSREKAGREKFGLRYLSRDNMRDAMEEGSDGNNYFFFKVLQNRRAGTPEHNIDRLLDGAKHAALLWKDAYDESRDASFDSLTEN